MSNQINQMKESKKEKKIINAIWPVKEVPCFTLRRCFTGKGEKHICPEELKGSLSQNLFTDADLHKRFASTKLLVFV